MARMELGLDGAWTSPKSHTPARELHELLTVEDVARVLKVSKSWVYGHTRIHGSPREERLPNIRIGKYLRFEATAVQAFLARKTRTS